MVRRFMVRSTLVVGSVATMCCQSPQIPKRDHADLVLPSPVVPNIYAVVGGTQISAREVDGKLGPRLAQFRTQEYRMRKKALDEIVMATLIDKEAATRKISAAALIAAEVDAKAKPVADEEARAVFESARDRMGQTPEADAIRSIANAMQRQRVNQRRAEFVSNLREKYDVRIMLEPPRFAPDTPNGPAMGPADAPVTVIEFSDFQCLSVFTS